MKKLMLSATVCLLGVTHTFAAPPPQITEIRLKDHTLFAQLEREVVFHRNDSLDLIQGVGKETRHTRYVLPQGEFQRLVELLNEQHFFDLKPRYVPELPQDSFPHDQQVVDSSYFIVSVTRNGQEKAVRFEQSNTHSTQPRNLWAVEKILRGEVSKAAER